MSLRLDVFVHIVNEPSETVTQRLDAVLVKLTQLGQTEAIMVQELDDLKVQVTRNTDVEQSALVLINGIAARIQAAIDAALAGGATPTALAAIVAEKNRLLASSEPLAAAVAANTV